ncbi:hypothetical protein D3C81_1872510 [compost metagenome]
MRAQGFDVAHIGHAFEQRDCVAYFPLLVTVYPQQLLDGFAGPVDFVHESLISLP